MTTALAIDDALQPADWVAELAKRGITASERSIREWANRAGAYFRIGRQMLISPDQMNQILQGKQKCPSNPTAEAKPGGRKVASNISENPSPDIIAPALDRLTKLAHGDGATTKKRG